MQQLQNFNLKTMRLQNVSIKGFPQIKNFAKLTSLSLQELPDQGDSSSYFCAAGQSLASLSVLRELRVSSKIVSQVQDLLNGLFSCKSYPTLDLLEVGLYSYLCRFPHKDFERSVEDLALALSALAYLQTAEIHGEFTGKHSWRNVCKSSMPIVSRVDLLMRNDCRRHFFRHCFEHGVYKE